MPELPWCYGTLCMFRTKVATGPSLEVSSDIYEHVNDQMPAADLMLTAGFDSGLPFALLGTRPRLVQIRLAVLLGVNLVQSG